MVLNYLILIILLTMALLKEDGSLDVERIDNLPYEDYMKET